MATNAKKPVGKGLLIYIIVLAGLIFLMVYLIGQTTKSSSEYSYSDIMNYFDNYQVSKYDFDLGTGQLNMTVNDDGNSKQISYTVPNVSVFLDEVQMGDDVYREKYNEKNPDAPLEVEYYRIQDNSWLLNLLPTLLIVVLMIAFFFMMMRQAGGGGKINTFSKANIKNTSNRNTTFADVAGADEEKSELAEVVDFLKNPNKYNEIGARSPKGVLLMGPPGTGKTLLAKAVAGEAGAPFFPISGSDFLELYVGVGASRVRDLFETAKKAAPSIIFIDEIDAVGRHRGAGMGGGHDEREQTLNQMLVEMDGFESNSGVIVIAATNRKDILDPALLRPGRFDRQIYVNYPDIKGREEILKVHTRKKPLAPDVNLATIAKSTAGFTGADLENLVNEAALLAARANRKSIIEKDIEEATIKVVAGPEKKSKVVSDEDKKLTAYHEAGHAIAAHNLETQDKVHHVTIIPRGMAGGFTMQLPEKDTSYVTKRWMKEEMIVLLGGRVAEQIILDDISTGASNDLERCTKIARDMVTKYGFSRKLGNVVYGGDDNVFLGRDYGHQKSISDGVAADIDAEIRRFIDQAYESCEKLLKDHIEQLHTVAKYLIKHEKLDGDDFVRLLNGEDLEAEFQAEEISEMIEEVAEETVTETTEIAENTNEIAEETSNEETPSEE